MVNTNGIDHIGHKFGMLTVIRRAEPVGRSKHIHWLTSCDCGGQKVVKGKCLRDGSAYHCGCLLKSILSASATKHGHSRGARREYSSWSSMKQRCLSPTHIGWEYYGGRGISICQRWIDSYEAFYEDMGTMPDGKYSLDRYPDHNGNYEPGNCRWATDSEQNKNRRPMGRKVMFLGQLITIAELAKFSPYQAITVRNKIIRQGLSPEEAIKFTKLSSVDEKTGKRRVGQRPKE